MDVSVQLHVPAASPHVERILGVHWTGGLMGPRVNDKAAVKEHSLLCPSRKSNSDRSVRNLVTVPTELTRPKRIPRIRVHCPLFYNYYV
jgi:hypothetical protein